MSVLRRILHAAAAAIMVIDVVVAQDPDLLSDASRFVGTWCARCHGGEKPEADLDLARFPRGFASPAATLSQVARRLRAGEMPPKEAPQPPAEAVAALIARIDESDRAASRPRRVTIRRLSRYEYGNTVRDLLGVDPPTGDFPVDDAGYGFDNIGDVLGIPPILLEKYAAAAEALAIEAVVDEDAANPPRSRVPARDLSCSIKDSFRGPFRILYAPGQAGTRIVAPRAGEYRVRARVFGDQAGPEAVKAVFYADRRKSDPIEITATRDAPTEVEHVMPLPHGLHTIAIAFVNDYYRPDDPDPAKRDRNLAVEWIEVVGPVDRREPPPSHHAIFATDPGGADPAVRFRAILRPLLLRGWRRPPSDAEIERVARLALEATADGSRFERGVQVALQAILTSPHFLLRAEPAVAGGSALGGFELATRLSYFLWSSMPDERLFELAASGALAAPESLRAEVGRMLADPRASALAENFAAQWLELRNLDDAAPDPARFPSFDEELRTAMRRETEMLFEAVLRERRPVRELVDADFTFVNERLAAHYGIPGIRGAHMRRVRAPADRGGGVLAHASILTVTSNATRTSPVKRGKFVLDNLLDAPPPAPPPGVGALDERPEAVRGATVRERLERHRTDPSCASCHARIDPLGFALEAFDPIGARRTTDEARPVDSTAKLPGGAVVTGLNGLRVLIRDDRALVRSLAKKLFVYAVGRGIDPVDERAVAGMIEGLPPAPAIEDVISGVVLLDAFRKRDS